MHGLTSISKETRAQFETTVAALRRASSYPEGEEPVEAIETHMAWVFLTEAHAYKLKKPIRTSLIDYRTREARRRACETELVLNRRLAAPVYQAVVPVTEVETGRKVGGDEPPVDWLVKMRRLPRERMLDACIQRGTVSLNAVQHLGAKLTAFYERAEPLGWSPGTYRGRVVANVRAKGASLERPHYGLNRSLVRAVVAGLLRWTTEHPHLLGARGAGIVDAHGDLRPEHVCLTDPPMVIDCLEFNRTLRLHDPASDLAFLSLECNRLGASWIGERLIAHYRTRTEDDVSAPLLSFYEAYHALIRAAIAIWHLDDDRRRQASRWRRMARRYLQLARERV